MKKKHLVDNITPDQILENEELKATLNMPK